MQPPENPYNQPPLPNPNGDPQPFYGSGLVNDSGSGASAKLPPELRGVNIGAFLMNWIWAIAHNYWLGLLCLLPCVGFFMAVYMLINGNEIAWQNRRFESVQQFQAVQKKWLTWGIALTLFGCVCYGLLTVLSTALQIAAPNSGGAGAAGGVFPR